MRASEAIAFTVSLCVTTAEAQNLREAPLGALSASLGQTGVAAPPEEGSALLNPAAFAALDGDQLSLSTMVLTTASLPLEAANPPPGELARESRGSGGVSYLPSSVAYGRAFGDRDLTVAGALSVLIPTFETHTIVAHRQSGDDSGFELKASDVERRLKRVYIGPSGALGFGSLRVGASLFFSVTQYAQNTLIASTVGDLTGVGGTLLGQITDERQIFGLAGVAGAQLDVLDGFTLGLSVRSGLGALGGSARLRALLRDAEATRSTAARAEETASTVDFPDPPQLRGGLAIRLAPRVILRAEAIVTLVLDDPTIGEFSLTLTNLRAGQPVLPQSNELEQRMTAQTSVNGSLGAQIGLTDTLALNVGFLTDLSSSGPVKEDLPRDGDQPPVAFLRIPKIDRYWATLGVSFSAGALAIHAGAAGGLLFYKSSDIWSAGSETDQIGVAARIFFSGGVSTERLLGML
ncbi:MAG: hypothetical protein IT384_09830 [Deltaproteobacteria bacterium]|nr:hypothetical protein [Deltaproteobacteria bacterium]